MKTRGHHSNLASSQQGKISLWILIPFTCLALVLILYFGFANTLLKNVAQSSLGQASGAEVNIDKVTHSIFPFGITLTQVQATDNANPMRNKLAISLVKADVKLMSLLDKKLIIEELIVQDIEFDTERENEGEVYIQPDAQTSSFVFPSLQDLPSVDEILAKSPLKTTAAVAEAKTVVERYQQPLSQQYASLPNKEKLKSYAERLKALNETDYKNPLELANANKEFNQIKRSVEEEKAKVTQFIDLAKEARKASSDAVNALKTAPQEDYELLKGLVAGDAAAIGQVTQHLFGEKAKIYTQTLLIAIDMLGGKEASTVEEDAVDDGLPNVWIKKAAMNIKWHGEKIESNWQNITDQHARVGKPTTFLIDSSKANNWSKIALNGSFEILAGKVNSVQSWNIQELVLNSIALVPEGAKQTLNALLESGLLASAGELKIVDNELSGSSKFDLSALKLKASGETDLSSAMAEIISGLSELNLTANFAGSLTKPSIRVKSDLDKKMLQALTSGLTDNTSGKLGELKSKLNARVAEQLGKTGEQFESIDPLLAAAQGNSDSLNELLKSQMTNEIDKNKDKLLNKLGDKLFRER